MSLIRADGLTKRFGSVTALDALTLEVSPGITGLVGANGAGKSTLLKILLGLLPATEGTRERARPRRGDRGPAIRERVGYMPEHDCLPPDVSATEFVVHMARMSGLPTTAARERAADTLRHVGLYEERYRPMGGYSTGHASTGQARPGPRARPQPGASRRADERARPRRPRRHARADPADRLRVRHLGHRHLPPPRRARAGLPRDRGDRGRPVDAALQHGVGHRGDSGGDRRGGRRPHRSPRTPEGRRDHRGSTGGSCTSTSPTPRRTTW